MADLISDQNKSFIEIKANQTTVSETFNGTIQQGNEIPTSNVFRNTYSGLAKQIIIFTLVTFFI